MNIKLPAGNESSSVVILKQISHQKSLPMVLFTPQIIANCPLHTTNHCQLSSSHHKSLPIVLFTPQIIANCPLHTTNHCQLSSSHHKSLPIVLFIHHKSLPIVLFTHHKSLPIVLFTHHKSLPIVLFTHHKSLPIVHFTDTDHGILSEFSPSCLKLNQSFRSNISGIFNIMVQLLRSGFVKCYTYYITIVFHLLFYFTPNI